MAEASTKFGFPKQATDFQIGWAVGSEAKKKRKSVLVDVRSLIVQYYPAIL